MKAIERIPALIDEQIEPWVMDHLRRAAEQARIDGASKTEVLEAFGLADRLAARPHISGPLSALADRFSEIGKGRRSEAENLELRDLAEAAVMDGAKPKEIAEALSVSRATVRNILNPYYMEQTPVERRAYAQAQRERMEGLEGLI